MLTNHSVYLGPVKRWNFLQSISEKLKNQNGFLQPKKSNFGRPRKSGNKKNPNRKPLLSLQFMSRTTAEFVYKWNLTKVNTHVIIASFVILKY